MTIFWRCLSTDCKSCTPTLPCNQTVPDQSLLISRILAPELILQNCKLLQLGGCDGIFWHLPVIHVSLHTNIGDVMNNRNNDFARAEAILDLFLLMQHVLRSVGVW